MINIKVQLICLNIKLNSVKIRINNLTDRMMEKLKFDSNYDCESFKDQIFMLKLKMININSQIAQLRKYNVSNMCL